MAHYLIILMLATAALGSVDEPPGHRIEGIAAVVGNEIILHSQVEDLLEYELERRGLKAPPDSTVATLRAELLEQLVDDRLLIDYARQNQTDVDEEEIDTALQERIDQIRSRFPSESSFIAQLEAEGLTLSHFRTLQRKAVEEQLLKYELQQFLRDTWRLQVTDSEIKQFCEDRRDEIPASPERVRLHQILLDVGAPAEAVARADSLLSSIRNRIMSGEDFADLASEYSMDGSAALGGDLGTFEKGSMVPEFEQALEDMEPGDLSGIVRTRFGLHLIQLMEKSDTDFHARHIIRILPQAEDPSHLLPLIETIASLAESVSLGELARKYSIDGETKDNGGFIDIVAPSAMEAGPLEALLDTIPENVLSAPMMEEDGVHLYWIDERIPEGKPSCDEIAPGIRDLLFMEKFETKLAELITQLKSETYIEIHD